MDRLRVSPTKSNLLRLRDELGFAREGKELLTQKREVLVMELLRLQDDAQHAREELDAQLAAAYLSFGRAAALDGSDGMARLALGTPAYPEVKVRERSVMGVVLPIIDRPTVPWQVRFGLAGASPLVEGAAELIRQAIEKLLEVAEIETAIYRLATETRKTLRRERALENLFIPQYQVTVKYIQDSLEEKERENFFQLKLLKGKRTE